MCLVSSSPVGCLIPTSFLMTTISRSPLAAQDRTIQNSNHLSGAGLQDQFKTFNSDTDGCSSETHAESLNLIKIKQNYIKKGRGTSALPKDSLASRCLATAAKMVSAWGTGSSLSIPRLMGVIKSVIFTYTYTHTHISVCVYIYIYIYIYINNVFI